MKYNKYKNRKTKVGGILFDSKAEADRYLELKAMEQSGDISDLRLQIAYELIPVQKESDKVGPRGGVIPGKVIHRPITYVADFVYMENGEEIVEDCKGVRTEVYKIKRKLFRYRYGKDIVETSEKRKLERKAMQERRERLKQEAIAKWENKPGG